VISLTISTSLAIFTWRRRSVAGAGPYAFYALAQASWTLGYIFELASPSLESKVFWDSTQWIGAMAVSPAFFAFAVEYTGHRLSSPRTVWTVLTIIPILVLLLVFTDGLHGLLYSAAELIPGEPFSTLYYSYGFAFWAISVYGYLPGLIGIALLVRAFLRPQHYYRQQIGTLLIGSLIPLVGTAMTVLDITLSFHRDTAPLTFALADLVLAWGLFRFQLFDIMPVARDTAIEVMSDGVMVVDTQNRVIDINPATRRILNLGEAKVVGLSAAQAFSARPQLVTLLQDREEVPAEATLTFSELDQRLDIRSTPLNNRQGSVTGHLLVVRDSTEQVRAEKALLISEEKYRHLVQSTPDWVWSTDVEGNHTFSNQAVEELLGYTADDIVGQPAFDYMHAVDRERIRELMRQAAEQLTGWKDVAIRWLHKDGSVRFFESTAQPILDAEGIVTGFSGIDRDISERIRSEEVLRKYRDQLEDLVEERTFRLLDVNEKLRREVAERKQAEESLRLHTERLQILHEIDRGILAAESSEAIARAAMSRLRQLIPCQRVGVVYIDTEANEARVLAFDAAFRSRYPDDDPIPLDQLQDIVEELAQGRIARFDDLDMRSELTKVLYSEGVRRSVIFPMLSWGELIGALSFWLTDQDSFTHEHENLARQLADQLSIALQQARLYEHVQLHAKELEQRVTDRTRELSALYEITAIASESLDLETTLTRSLEHVTAALDSDAGSIHLLAESADSLEMVTQIGIPPRLVPLIETLALEGPARWVIERDQPLKGSDLITDLGDVMEIEGAPRKYVGTPIRVNGRPVGILTIVRETILPEFSDEEIAALESISDRLGAIVENARLRNLTEQAAVIEERQRLARDLHDSVTQALYSLTLIAETGRRATADGELEAVEGYLARLGEVSLQALKEMRLLIYELRPPALEEEGLIGALQQRLDAVEGRAGVEARLLVDHDGQLPLRVEEALYRIGLEALNNALKHSQATSVTVHLGINDEQVVLEVVDNGQGFNLTDASDSGGMGLVSMRERAAAVGGELVVESVPGGKTTVYVAVDL
jgi:PAS domain S-box-containing protein